MIERACELVNWNVKLIVPFVLELDSQSRQYRGLATDVEAAATSSDIDGYLLHHEPKQNYRNTIQQIILFVH